MAYGITSESQLIDYQTIKRGCEQYINGLSEYIDCANQLQEAAGILTPKAISFDGTSLQEPIYEMSQEIVTTYNSCVEAAKQIYTEAVNIYNQQVEELNAYYKQQAEEEAKKRANNG